MARLAAIFVVVGVAIVAKCDVVLEAGEQLKNAVSAGTQPVIEGVVTTASGACTEVKKLVGVDYEQVQGAKEPDLSKLKLVLETKDSSTSFRLETAAQEILKSDKYNPQNKLMIFIHGFTEDPSMDSFRKMSEAFLAKGGWNVMALDGSSLIRWLYLRSSTYVRFMGEKLGAVLAAKVKDGVKPEEILLVGHSLGSHIGGFAGKTFRNLTGLPLGRISALDPAGPCFTRVDDDLKLQRTDASYVDVTHTDAGVLGLKESVGHSDYYPNGGSNQPNCLLPTCSHSRAWVYYAESVISERGFPARKCKDWETFKRNKCGDTEISYMGYASAPTTRGDFYLRTDGDSPFGLREDGLKFEGVLKDIMDGIKKDENIVDKTKADLKDFKESFARGGAPAALEGAFVKI